MDFPQLFCLFKGQNLSVFFVKNDQRQEVYNYKPENCCLFVYEVSSINEAAGLLLKNNQTIVCIGIENELKNQLARQAILTGTNRLVNVGNALNMNIYWDGYDIVSFLSKMISNI